MATIGGVDLQQKIGPVPIWVIVVGGGLGVAFLVNRRMTPTSALGTPTEESGVGGTPGGFVPAPRPDDPVVPTTPLDNEEWAFKAVTWLVGHGYDPIISGIAVRKYLDGEKLSSAEATLIGLVTKPGAVGLPPNIPIGGGVIPPPSPTPPITTPTTPPATMPKIEPSPVTPPTVPTLGVWAKVPRGALPQSANGTSQIMNYIMIHNGYPGGVKDVISRNKIWYHPNNTFRRIAFANDWTKLTMEMWVFVPTP